MIWLNIEVSTIRRPEYVGADPVHRATWLNLLAYCVEQENGGFIAGCADWKCRRWQQTCGVTLAEVNDPCDLWEITPEGVAVFAYPAAKQEEVQRKRDGGKIGGRRRAANAKTKLAKTDPSSTLPSIASSTPSRTPSTEGKGREGKGMERNGSTPPIPPAPTVPEEASESESAEIHEPNPKPGTGFPNHQEAMRRINSLRPEWERPVQWSGGEMHEFHGSMSGILSTTPEEWELLKRFLAANLAAGSGFWQPRSRGKFLSTFPDVLSSAVRWSGKSFASNGATKPKTLPLGSK